MYRSVDIAKMSNITMREKMIRTIYIAILLLFSVEYLGWGEISVYRVGILPLSLLGVVLIYSRKKSASYDTYVLLTIIYMLFFSLCLYSTNGNFLFPILTLPLAIFFFGFLTLKRKLNVDYSKIFIWYSAPHIIAFVFGVANYDVGRFAGLHEDPNFCGVFLGFSIVVTVELLFRGSIKYRWKSLLLLILTFDIFLLFLTGSRGAILSLLIIGTLLFMNVQIRKVWKILTILILIIFVWQTYRYILTLPDWVSPDDSIIDSILCRFKPDNMAEGSHRGLLWDSVISRLNKSNPWQPIGMKTAMMGLPNDYPHNTFLDMMVENGLYIGMVVSVIVLYWGIKSYLKLVKGVVAGYDYIFLWCCYSILLQLLFLSAIQQKIFWICVFFVFYVAHEKRKPNIIKWRKK